MLSCCGFFSRPFKCRQRKKKRQSLTWKLRFGQILSDDRLALALALEIKPTRKKGRKKRICRRKK